MSVLSLENITIHLSISDIHPEFAAMADRAPVPPGPSAGVTTAPTDSLGSENRTKAEPRPPIEMLGPRQVAGVAAYREATWVPIGREQEDVTPACVMYSQGLRLRDHVTSFFRIGRQASKGITNTADNSMVFVVMMGEVTVVLNTSQFLATRGDTIYIPPHSTYNLLNMGQDEAELFNFQYRNLPKKGV